MVEFVSKAQNLKALQGCLKSAKILPLIITSLQDYQKDSAKILESASKLGEKLIVRSSSRSEDGKDSSNAGEFLSLANITHKELLSAIKRVGESMPSVNDEILIQPMLENIELCGVGFSVDKDNCAPYYCIEYDRSGSSHSITDGSAKEAMSYFHYREAPLPNDLVMAQVITMIRELEKIFDYPFLDVEFAFVREEGELKLYCLQVRPLVMKGKAQLLEILPLESLERLKKRFLNLQNSSIGVLGERAIFGVMPDWNPAEMIGLKPKRLAFSLYKEIITDNIWAYQRDNYGYRALRSHPLMVSFLGIPYIDVRLSFNSFIPKTLNEDIASKLVNHYLKTLIENPEYHDKIEFAIVHSCYDFNMSKKLEKLLEITNRILNPQNGFYLQDLEKIKKLKTSYQKIKESHSPLIDKIYWLIEEVKRYGTLPFAGIARAGFIAMQLLNSLVEIGFLSLEEKNLFLNSLNTVSKKLSKAIATLNADNKKTFLEEFGHLRAGTYNILSPRYDEAFEEYFVLKTNESAQESKAFVLSAKKKSALGQLIKEHGLQIGTEELLEFIKTAIEAREFAKFEFTRLLSEALVLIEKLGEYYGIHKEEMAHLDIKNILVLYSSLYSQSPKNKFLEEIERHKKEYELTLSLKLPPLLTESQQIFGYFTQNILPNFITQKIVTAPIARENEREFAGKIVLIYAADPGYDYLFTKGIAGFITCYGGANSHMAIRASELGMPAVIGVGEEAFKKYLQGDKICIDCESEQVFCL